MDNYLSAGDFIVKFSTNTKIAEATDGVAYFSGHIEGKELMNYLDGTFIENVLGDSITRDGKLEIIFWQQLQSIVKHRECGELCRSTPPQPPQKLLVSWALDMTKCIQNAHIEIEKQRNRISNQEQLMDEMRRAKESVENEIFDRVYTLINSGRIAVKPKEEPELDMTPHS